MSVDIQKQLDLRPYSDKNVVTKPAAPSQTTAQAPVDEEKSNAAKWMIGLTAAAAIAIGGLYAAKHGHLGESAEKFAKKIFGEGSKEVQSSTSEAVTGATETVTQPLKETATKAIALSPLVIARKGISRLIKKPNKSLTEVMTELQQAGVKMEKKGENLLEIRTGKSPEDITKLLFNSDGTLASIQRATKKAQQEVFSFENGILRGIKRSYKNTVPEITQRIEFNDARKVSEEIFEFKETPLCQPVLKRVNGMKDTYTTGQSPSWYDILKNNYENLPAELKKAKIFYSQLADFETAPYMTARACKYYKSSLKDIPDEIPSEELVRFINGKHAKSFDNTVQDLDIARRISRRTGNISSKKILETTPRNIAEQFSSSRVAREDILQNIREFLPEKYSDDTVKTIAKLLEKDMGNAKDVDENIVIHAIRNYNSILNAYKINKPEHLNTVSKKISECSYDEIEALIDEIAPGKIIGVVSDPFKDKAEEQKTIMHIIKSITGRSSIKENTTIIDILPDLAKAK